MVKERNKGTFDTNSIGSPCSVTKLLDVELYEQPVSRSMTVIKMFEGAMTIANAVAKFKNRKGSVAATATIDPLTWEDISEMSWWPGILAIFTSYAIAPLITSLFFIGIGWQDYTIHKSRWWQCGVYCSALWLTSIQAFGFQLVKTKVRSQSTYEFFVPPILKSCLLYIASALFAFMVWAVCYVGWGYELIHPLGQAYAVAFAGIFGTSLTQTKFLAPAEFSLKKDTFFLILMGGALIPIALFLSLGALMGYIVAGGYSLCLVFFPISRCIVDMMMRKMTSFTNSDFLESIFVHTSSLCNNIFLIYSLSFNGPKSYGGIVFAGCMNSGLMVYYYLLLTSPLECQLGWDNQKATLIAWWNKRKPEYSIMTEEERIQAMDLRSKLVYLVILDMASQLILPWWLPLQLALIMFHTPANTSIVTLGFDITPESFTHRFNTALILNGLDIINMCTLTYFIRRKYPLFDPLRILTLIFEKFGLLPIAGIMFILISIICFFITDCGIEPYAIWRWLMSF